MDDYYQTQAAMPYFAGTSRQRGRGIGTVLRTVGRVAIPILKKYFVPTAKRVALDLANEFKSEALGIASGNVKPKVAFKRAVRNTAKRQLGGGVWKKKKSTRGNKTVKKSVL